MDYQEAIEEAEIQINMYESMILYNKDFEPKNDNSNYERKIDFLKTIISAMQEMQEYKQLGTLDEVREAMEKQRECKYCKYKTHSEIISELNSCNDCGLVNICEKRPEYGQYCRINCYDWRCRNER